MITMKDKIVKLIALILVLLSLAIQIFAQSKTLDNFETTNGWQIFTSDGVELKISAAKGVKGKSIRIDYNFTKGSGYGGIQKTIPIEYPDNYQFTFYLKGESPNNNLEFKLADESGDNVWWFNNRNYEFPTEWKKYVIKKRRIEFAWGPTKDKTLRKTARLEFTIASYNGGKGTVFIDELNFEPAPDTNTDLSKIELSSSSSVLELNNLLDGNKETVWTSDKKEKQEILIDLNGRKEFGGLKIIWDKNNFAKKFSVSVSDNNTNWERIYEAEKSSGFTSYIRLPEQEASFVKLEMQASSGKNGYSIKEMQLLDGEYSADPNRFLINIAKDFPRGYFPRYLTEEKSYWTITGVNADAKEALINEEGMVEVDKACFSLEPFLFVDDKLITWNDQHNIQSLENNYLPIPKVKRLGNIQLEVKAFSSGEANKSSVLYLSYTLKNVSEADKAGNFYLALRPFQVNPYYQWLNITGGAAKVKSIKADKNKIVVNNEKKVVSISKPSEIGASSFDDGEVINYLSLNQMPGKKFVDDDDGFASAAIKYSFELKPQEEKSYFVAVPFYTVPKFLKNANSDFVRKKFEETKKFWNEKVTHIKFNLPSSADKIVNTIRTNLANILINRDNYGIQPGSRSYERSWIRDGALTSSALLKNGIVDEVRGFADWYAANQFDNGKVPCVVDHRGPDPVPEHDSHGEFIYLIRQYFNYTKDTTWLKSKYENVKRAVDYLKFLIDQRSTDFYKNSGDSLRAYYGILPESISHEGYSDKPRHSYWDSFFGMKGLKDAVEIAEAVGSDSDAARFKIIRDDFKTNLYNSIRLAAKQHKINFIPGCVELGDFDATSTTISLYPCNERGNLPTDLLQNTFDRYWDFTQARAKPETDWLNYTPYEVRTIGSFIFMDQPERAHWLTNYFLNDLRPQGWNHWAEVVWKDIRLPRFIGDMPHTWVGSDFINAMRAMFIYENEYDSTLVIGAGLKQEWIDAPEGMSIENLPAYYGEVSYSIKKEEDSYKVKLFGDAKIPSGGVVLKNFNGKILPKKVLVNGNEIKSYSNNAITIMSFPAEVMIDY